MTGSPQLNVLAINGSTRRNDDVAALLQHVLRELQLEGIQTELIELSGAEIYSCLGCMACSSDPPEMCVQADDAGNAFIESMMRADGILLGAPALTTAESPELMALLDRACMIAKANGRSLRHKVGAAVVPAQQPGTLRTFDAMNHFFLVNEMIVAGSSYWDTGIGCDAGELELDPHGIARMRTLGRNMAWALENLHGPKAMPDLPDIVSQ